MLQRKVSREVVLGRGEDQILTLKLIIGECLSHQTPIVLSFMYYEQAPDSADKRALAKVSFLVWYTRQIC